MTLYITYFRVSTDRQGKSGLGLDAQQEAVRRFLRPDDRVISSFTEVESGRKSDRPQLGEALDACRRTGATLAIAKLDRLSRSVSFIATLMDSGVPLVAVDNPSANRLTLHILAAVAEAEAEAISARTKAALAAAKERGTTLGGYRGVLPTAEQRARGRANRTDAARRRAAPAIQAVADARASGATSLNEIAAHLNTQGVRTPRGGCWTATQVMRVIQYTN